MIGFSLISVEFRGIKTVDLSTIEPIVTIIEIVSISVVFWCIKTVDLLSTEPVIIMVEFPQILDRSPETLASLSIEQNVIIIELSTVSLDFDLETRTAKWIGHGTTIVFYWRKTKYSNTGRHRNFLGS